MFKVSASPLAGGSSAEMAESRHAFQDSRQGPVSIDKICYLNKMPTCRRAPHSRSSYYIRLPRIFWVCYLLYKLKVPSWHINIKKFMMFSKIFCYRAGNSKECRRRKLDSFIFKTKIWFFLPNKNFSVKSLPFIGTRRLPQMWKHWFSAPQHFSIAPMAVQS